MRQHDDKAVCESEAGKTKRRKIETLAADRAYVQAQLDLLRARHDEASSAFEQLKPWTFNTSS